MNRHKDEMRLDEAISHAVDSAPVSFDPQKWCREHPEEVQMLKSLGERTRHGSHARHGQLRRVLMRSVITKLAAAAAMVLVAFLGLSLLTTSSESRSQVWAIEQTIRALKDVDTCIASGTADSSIPFKCWAKRNQDDENSFNMRYESEEALIVVNGTTCQVYIPSSNEVRILEGPAIHELKFWYKAMELKVWLAGSMLETLKENADDWKETYGKDEQTGRDCVFVTCSYKPLSASFWFQFDLETHLAVRLKQWLNVNREGQPTFYVDSIVYNKEIPDRLFDFEPPDDAKVVSTEEARERTALLNRAQKLFDQKEYAKAIEAYQEIYETHPQWPCSEEALMMIGICYNWMEQFDKAIEAYEKAVREYPHLKYQLASTYYYLGSAYLETGQKERAVEAFKSCLQVGQGLRDPDRFPMKNARECIERFGGKE